MENSAKLTKPAAVQHRPKIVADDSSHTLLVPDRRAALGQLSVVFEFSPVSVLVLSFEERNE
jgi:hypothetical protein